MSGPDQPVTETRIEWGVRWLVSAERPGSSQRDEKWSEETARRGPGGYTNTKLIRRTVTYGPWVVAE